LLLLRSTVTRNGNCLCAFFVRRFEPTDLLLLTTHRIIFLIMTNGRFEHHLNKSNCPKSKTVPGIFAQSPLKVVK
jgi:hypothetical protein